MNMFCYQCQETVKNEACTKNGVCGKDDVTANLQDLLIYILQGIALLAENYIKKFNRKNGAFVSRALFATITNANFSRSRIIELIKEAIEVRENIKSAVGKNLEHDSVNWTAHKEQEFIIKAGDIGILSYSDNDDIRSLKSLLLYGVKGIAAYTDHAAVLGYYDDEIFKFYVKGLSALAKDISAEELTNMVLEAGEKAVRAMKLLDKAHTSLYGNPEVTNVNIGVGKKPGILVSGHDLRDFQEILNQTEKTGIDVYTHGEMLPANYYPKFKKYRHFAGNYGNSWWEQNSEFESFNGPIVMTTNCIIPVKDSYADRMFTTGMTGYPGIKHIPDRKEGEEKDFSEVIKMARKCLPPEEIEKGSLTGGFGHNQVEKFLDKITEAVKNGSIKRFVVMAGCDGRHSSRKYFTRVAENLPEDTVVLTAGCAKYRYNKLEFGEIEGIPRLLDAGQCNDSYSLAVSALKLKDAFELEDINDLPLSFDIAWYEQKAVAVLLALLSLGFKKIRLGPTLPAFLSPAIKEFIVGKFDLMPISEEKEDIQNMMAGQ